MTLLLAALVSVGAAFVQGVTGFGFGLLVVGFFALLFGPWTGVLVLSVVGPLLSLEIYLRVRKHVDWRETLWLALPVAVVGVPLGVLMFGASEPELLNRIVGVLLIVSAAYFLSPWAPRPKRLSRVFTVGAGVLAGFLGGLTSTGGPPLVLYLWASEMRKETRMAVLQAVFLVASFTKIIQLLYLGWLTGPIVRDSAILALPVLAGVYVGQRLFDRIPAEPLRKASLVLLLVLGVVLLIPR
ncbi:MAG: sulfite exporter TauE/SafE family protein [Planctomycetota bacterium]